MRIVLYLAMVILLLLSTISTSNAVEVRYAYVDYTYKLNEDIVQVPVTNTFVICSNCPITELKPYQESFVQGSPTIPFEQVPYPVLSVMVSDGQATKTEDKKTDFILKKEIKPLSVFFDFNNFDLNEMERTKIQTWAKDTKGVEVEVIGYACPIGKEDYNKILSAKRAGTVADELRKSGVIVVKEKGAGETTQFGSDKKEYYLNRRTEIIPIKKGGE